LTLDKEKGAGEVKEWQGLYGSSLLEPVITRLTVGIIAGSSSLGEGREEAFERTLGEAAVRYGWRVHAYVVMNNHFHLAIQLAEPNLSEGMKWLQGTWIRRFNGLRGLIGRPFQGRYKALLVEPGHAFGQVCHYIHLNPVRAKVIEPAKLNDYRLSSLPKFSGKNRPEWLEPSTVLAEAGGLPDTPAGWRHYRGYLEFMTTDSVANRALLEKKLSRGWCIGGDGFRQAMKQEAIQRGMVLDLERFGGLEPETVRTERTAAWDEQLQRLAKKAKIDLLRLPDQKSAPEKVLLAAAMKRSTSVSNGWLADRLHMGKAASMSQFSRRLLLTASGKDAVERLLSKVKT